MKWSRMPENTGILPEEYNRALDVIQFQLPEQTIHKIISVPYPIKERCIFWLSRHQVNTFTNVARYPTNARMCARYPTGRYCQNQGSLRRSASIKTWRLSLALSPISPGFPQSLECCNPVPIPKTLQLLRKIDLSRSVSNALKIDNLLEHKNQDCSIRIHDWIQLHPPSSRSLF